MTNNKMTQPTPSQLTQALITAVTALQKYKEGRDLWLTKGYTPPFLAGERAILEALTQILPIYNSLEKKND
jgi:hypothetical protein